MSKSLVTAVRQKGKTRIKFGSCLDVANASDLKKGLAKLLRRKPPFELDASNVERVDTAGLQVLLAFKSEMAKREIDLHWQAVSDPLRSAADMLGLSGELGLID